MTSNRDFPVEMRAASLADVDTRQRLIDVIIAPYEQETEVFWRGEVWREKFLRSAFDGIENHAGRIAVNREHVVGNTVGKTVALDPRHDGGLLGRLKIVRGDQGDHVLNLAEEDMVGISGGFVMRPSDVQLDKRAKLRTVTRSFLDHVSFVESPAYEGARVLAVREGRRAPETAAEPLSTPALDEFLSEPVFQWADRRLNG